MLEYTIEEAAAMTAVGFKRRFKNDTAYLEIPKFWEEWMENSRGIMGMFGICVDTDGNEFDYWIADPYDPEKGVPEGCEKIEIPGGLWAEFPCRGPLPESLQSVNTRIWSEWLPDLKGYELAAGYTVEVYLPPAADPKDTLSFIRIPIKKN